MKKYIDETKIIKLIILLPITGVLVTSFILTNIFISSMNEAHKLEITNIKTNHINNLKNKIEERIESLSILLNNNYDFEVKQAKNKIQNSVYVTHEKLKTIYEKNKNLPKEKILELINEELKEICLFEPGANYFAYTFEGKKIYSTSNKETKQSHETFLKALKNNNESFIQWNELEKGSNKNLKTLGFAKKFEPLGIYVANKIYLNQIKNEISKNTINFIESLDYKNNGYIFILNSKKRILSHKNKNIINIPFEKLDKKTRKNLNNHLLKARADKGTFVEYTQSKKIFKDFELTKKISYIKAIPFLDWVIGTGLYTDNLDTHLNEKKALLEVKLQNDVRTIIIFSSLVTFIIIIFLIFLSRKLKNIFHFYSKNLEDSNLKLKKLNEKLEEKVQKQVNAIRQKDVLINQQSKLVAMGEMIGNIAHQWRQPLSAISSIASGIIIKKEIGKIEENNFQEDLEAIISTTKVLSTTIDDFRNFYSKEKTISHFKIENTIEKVLSLISANIKNSDINLIKNIEELEITSYENELIQVILNIINNAKDALCENIQTTKYIFIKVKQNKNELTINIYDNGGGISENIINRIFEPYFTTKFKAQGTGIGLYMTKNIIEKNLKGRIKVKNKKFVYNEKEYKGALFKIELPLNLNP